jgi:hypothetical protein
LLYLLLIFFDFFFLVGGYVYCIAIPQGALAEPTSIGQVRSAATDDFLNSGGLVLYPIGSKFPLSLSLSITELLPLTSYAVYCYAETLSGTGNSLNQVIATRSDVTTACCKKLSFSNKPAFVFGDLTKYTSSTVQSTYVFTYVLSSAPSSRLEVKPEINSTEVSANPSSLIFTSTSSLTGQFSLSALPTIGGTYAMFLSTKGTDGGQYEDSTVISIVLLASTTPLPAPILLSSRFSDSGHNVLLTFNVATDQAGLSGSFPCSSLFAFARAGQSTCSWMGSSSVRVSFGVFEENVTYLAVMDSVLLHAKLNLRAFCSVGSTTCSSNLISKSQSVVTQKPRNPVRPVVIISAPSELGSCSNLSLDATGSYGSGSRRYISVEWTVTAVIYGPPDIAIDVSSVQASLNAFSAKHQVIRPFTVSLKGKATYTLTLSLRNFLGLSSFISVVVNVASDPNIPTLSVIGPSYLQITAATRLNVQSTAKFSTCARSTTKIRYTWRLLNVDTRNYPALVSSSLDTSKYSLPAYSLAVGSTYALIVTATVGTSSSSAAPVTIFVSQGLVTAAVVGGYIRSTPIDQNFILDASISKDTNVNPTSVIASNLVYKVMINDFTPTSYYVTHVLI